jgi:hypothetical protein
VDFKKYNKPLNTNILTVSALRKKPMLPPVQKNPDAIQSKRKRLSIVKEDPLSKTIGICEGPSDLAEKHDKYVYG